MNGDVQIFLLSVLSDTYLEVELLGPMEDALF